MIKIFANATYSVRLLLDPTFTHTHLTTPRDIALDLFNYIEQQNYQTPNQELYEEVVTMIYLYQQEHFPNNPILNLNNDYLTRVYNIDTVFIRLAITARAIMETHYDLKLTKATKPYIEDACHDFQLLSYNAPLKIFPDRITAIKALYALIYVHICDAKRLNKHIPEEQVRYPSKELILDFNMLTKYLKDGGEVFVEEDIRRILEELNIRKKSREVKSFKEIMEEFKS